MKMCQPFLLNAFDKIHTLINKLRKNNLYSRFLKKRTFELKTGKKYRESSIKDNYGLKKCGKSSLIIPRNESYTSCI